MGKFSDYKIALKSLPAGTHTFVFRPDMAFFKNMENTDVHGANLEVTLTIDYRNDVYALEFKVGGEVTLLCDRCLDSLEWPLDCGYKVNVVYGADYDDSADGTLVIPESDTDLNVAYMIYETIALAIPMKHVHPLGKCNRAMSKILKRHRVGGSADPEEESLEDSLIDEMDTMEPDDDTAVDDVPSDPRWDGLKKLKDNEQ